LLDRRWSGKVALVNEPTIGLFDAALAVQAAGLATFEDIGDLSKAEVDKLFKHWRNNYCRISGTAV